MAIINDDIDSWREFKKARNKYNKMVKTTKNEYYNKKLDIQNKGGENFESNANSNKKCLTQ